MKKLIAFSSLLLFLMPLSTLMAQAPAGFTAGYIVAADGSRIDGYIKESFKSKAAVVFQPASGKKVNYGGNAVNEVNISGVSYITYANDFFKVISTGAKASLLQKVSDATGKVIYNGSEAAGISSGTEGRINDFFVRPAGQSVPTLINKDNLNTVAVTLFADCPALLEKAKAGQMQVTDLESIIAQFNACK